MSNLTDRPKSKQGKSNGADGPPVPADPASPVTSIDSAWRKRLLREDQKDLHSHPFSNLANAVICFERCPDWRDVLAYDDHSLSVIALSRPPCPEGSPLPTSVSSDGMFPRHWTDADSIRAATWLQHERIQVGKDIARQAALTVALSHPFHPVRDYLTSLAWDGELRIDYWLSTHLGASWSDYVAAVGSRFLVSAVARAFRPGSKVDTCLILEGEQGKLKSTALSTLFGQSWFTDELPDIRKKDAAIQLLGIWAVELAELDALEGVAVSSIKKFISRSIDRFRPPWGTHAVNVPRGCVFAATVNHSTYLKDETGGRRFWPVKTGHIDRHALAADRDQLWAEAVTRYQAGDPWYLETAKLVALAREEQDSRYESDPWEHRIRLFINGREDVSITEILEGALKKDRAEWTQKDQNRIARSLRVLGWDRFRARFGEEREWRYRLVTD